MNKKYLQSLITECGNVKILAATKYLNPSQMKEVYDSGITIFGENRVDSFLDKYPLLSDLDISWHFIGHLQHNKAKKIIDKIDCLHSLDSLELAKEIEKNRTKPLNCFVELHLTNKIEKSGIEEKDIDNFLKELKQYKMIKVIGFMAMSDKDMSDEEKYHIFVKAKSLNDQYGFKELSMGMSADYKLAIKAGSTIVRLGHILLNE